MIKAKKRIISSVLLLALVMSAFLNGFVFMGTGEVYAAEKEPPAIKDTYVVDGITYYDVKSSHIDSPIQLYEDMINKEHSSIGGISLGKLWMLAGLGFIAPDALARSFMDGTYRLPALQNFLLTGQKDEDHFTGYVRYYYNAPIWNRDGSYVETSCAIKSMFGGELEVTARFSDFKVVPLIPGDSDHYISSTVENSPSSESTEIAKDVALRNDTASSTTIERSLGSSSTEGLTTSLTHTKSYSFSEHITFSSEFEAKIFGVSTKSKLEVGVAFEQSFSDAETNTETKAKTFTDNSKASVSLQPYTTVLLNVSNSDLTTTTRYNCPIGLMYKVTVIVEGNGFGLGIRTFTFGGTNNNAISDLNTRAFIDGQERLDPESINWPERLKDSTTKDAIQKITTHVPMSSMGATTRYLNKTTLYTIKNLVPLYPLRYVEITNKDNLQKSMKAGTFFYTEAIGLSGFNYKDGPYYDFVPYGNWVVVDENGNEITDGSGSVVLEKVEASGQTRCRAVRAGTGYIKFMIDEKSYPNENINSQTYVTNKDLSKTAVIEIDVTDDKEADNDKVVQFSITGNYIGIVNSEAEQIEGDEDGKLQVTATDSTGKEIETSYEWEAKQLESKGIKIEKNGMISFKKTGHFQVRVITPNGKYYSDWKTINAEPNGSDERDETEYDDDGIIIGTEYADADTVIEISGSYTGGVSSDSELIEGAGKLKVRAHDSHGKEKAIIYTWETDNENGMTLAEDGTVSFAQKGLYHVRVRSGEYVSDWTAVTANDYAPARFTSLPTATMNTYDGKAHELLNDDAKYEGGIRLMYGLGEDATNKPTEFNSFIPEATDVGTYYVWCMVCGDSNHENSEAVCVASSIDPLIQPDPETDTDTGTETDTGTDNGTDETVSSRKSSGGGCNSGFGFFAVVLIGAVLFVKKSSALQ